MLEKAGIYKVEIRAKELVAMKVNLGITWTKIFTLCRSVFFSFSLGIRINLTFIYAIFQYFRKETFAKSI